MNGTPLRTPKRRRRNVLGLTKHEERNADNTLKALGCKQERYESSPEEYCSRSRNGRKNSEGYWDTAHSTSSSSSSFDDKSLNLDYSEIGGAYEKRRDAICLLFQLMGSPEHDHLVLMWEKEAINYMKEIGWYDRFIKISGLNNMKVSKYNQMSVVGDSPELARALDSYGFSDLEVSMKFHVAITKGLRDDDPKKFQMGTPQQVWMCMLRCWELCEPTSERIVEDIQGLVGVLEQIIENQGRVIPGDDLRKGHRAERHDGKGKLNSRLRNNQRKDSQYERPIHPDAQAAYDALVNFEDINRALFPDE